MNNIRELKDYEYFRSPTGKGVLYKGDCLEIMPLLEEKSIDFICCDLPYQMTSCDWDILIPFEPLWQNYKRVRKDNTAIALFGSEPFSSELRLSNKKEYKYDWVWDKVKPSGFQLAKIKPLLQHENISIFYKAKIFYNPIKEQRDKIIKSKVYSFSKSNPSNNIKNIYFYSDKYPKSILIFSNANQTQKLHPTQKPVALIEYLIKTYTNENMLVLDNTAGSCTLAIACENLNRNYICIEQSEEYCEIGKKRIIEATKQLKLF